MVWEPVTNSCSLPLSESDISIYFYFHNRTSVSLSDPTEYSLFGQSNPLVFWIDFASQTSKFAITSQTIRAVLPSICSDNAKLSDKWWVRERKLSYTDLSEGEYVYQNDVLDALNPGTFRRHRQCAFNPGDTENARIPPINYSQPKHFSLQKRT